MNKLYKRIENLSISHRKQKIAPIPYKQFKEEVTQGMEWEEVLEQIKVEWVLRNDYHYRYYKPVWEVVDE